MPSIDLHLDCEPNIKEYSPSRDTMELNEDIYMKDVLVDVMIFVQTAFALQASSKSIAK